MNGSNEALMRLAWNAAGAGAIIAWNFVCGTAMFALLKVDSYQLVSLKFNFFLSLKALKLFRVNEADELQGLDIIKHNEPAYPKGVTLLCDYKSKVQTVDISRCEHRGGPGAQVPADGRPLQGGDGQQLGQEEEHGDQ